MIHRRQLILDAMRARVAMAWPTAQDVTEEPHAVEPRRLPAFAVRIEPGEAEPRAMGLPGAFIHDDALEVAAWIAGGRDHERRLHALAFELERLALARPEGLGGLVRWVERADTETETAAGETRVGRLLLRFRVRFTSDPAEEPPEAEAFAGAFSAAFD